MNKKLLYLVALGGLLSVGAYAQVTIGSGDKPAEGALLDLKEFDDATAKAGGRNAEKGLGLPRVKLTVKNALADIDGATGTGYEGLMVYNVGDEGGLCPGIHVWDGSDWIAIMGAPEKKPDIVMTDGDGNSYNAKWFHPVPCYPSDGAYWTTSNLYSTTDGNGSSFPETIYLNPGSAGAAPAVAITTPADLVGTVVYGESATHITIANINQPMSDFAKKFGLLYNFSNAKLACSAAEGWRLPNATDWDKLFTSMGGMSLASGPMRANNNYYLAIDSFGGAVYKWGENDNAGTILSGFNALPAGNIMASGLRSFSFGEYGIWWSDALDLRYWNVSSNSTQIYGQLSSDGKDHYSVRCVKD